MVEVLQHLIHGGEVALGCVALDALKLRADEITPRGFQDSLGIKGLFSPGQGDANAIADLNPP